jgi:hypothetical protein
MTTARTGGRARERDMVKQRGAKGEEEEEKRD